MTSDQATVGAFLVGCLVAGGSLLVWLFPKVRTFFRAMAQMFETINGSPAQIDRAGREQKPEVPSLSVQLGDIKQAISDQTEQNERLTALETLTSDHGQRLTALEQTHQMERALGHVAAAKTFDAIEAVARKSHPPEPRPAEEPDTEL